MGNGLQSIPGQSYPQPGSQIYSAFQPGGMYYTPPRSQVLGASSAPTSFSNGYQSVPGQATPAGINTAPTGSGYKAPTGGSSSTQNTNQQNVNPPSPQGISNSDVDNAYNDANGALNDYYNQTMSGKQDFINSYVSPYAALQPGLDASYQQGVNQTNLQADQARQQTSSVVDSARRLYGELSKAYQQRFGGSNSAGAFGQAYLGNAYQTQSGQAQNQLGQNLQALEAHKSDLLTQYNANLQQLNAQKANAEAQAQKDFQDKLDQISNMKVQFSGQKAQAKLQALQDYKNQINTLNNNLFQASQQLRTQALAGVQNLTQAYAQYAGYSGKPVDVQALSNFYLPAMNGYSQQLQNSYISPTGQVAGQKKDQNGNYIQ